MFDTLNLRIGLLFGAGIKGKKRVVRTLLGGTIAFGDGELPVGLHGRDRIQNSPSGPEQLASIDESEYVLPSRQP